MNCIIGTKNPIRDRENTYHMFDTSSKTIAYAPRLNYLRETAFDPHFF